MTTLLPRATTCHTAYSSSLPRQPTSTHSLNHLSRPDSREPHTTQDTHALFMPLIACKPFPLPPFRVQWHAALRDASTAPGPPELKPSHSVYFRWSVQAVRTLGCILDAQSSTIMLTFRSVAVVMGPLAASFAPSSPSSWPWVAPFLPPFTRAVAWTRPR